MGLGQEGFWVLKNRRVTKFWLLQEYYLAATGCLAQESLVEKDLDQASLVEKDLEQESWVGKD